jgi:hypothetical protein
MGFILGRVATFKDLAFGLGDDPIGFLYAAARHTKGELDEAVKVIEWYADPVNHEFREQADKAREFLNNK